MFRLLLWIACTALLGALAAWTSEHPGALTLTWLGWRVDTSVAVLFGTLALACAASTLAGLLLRGAWLLPRRFRHRRRERAYRLGLRFATESLAALGTGDFTAARALAGRMRRHLPHTPLALLLSAQAARAMGDDAALQPLLEAMLTHRETRFLAARRLSDRSTLDPAEALPFAQEAHALRPKDIAAAETLAGIYARLDRFPEAERVVRGLRAPKVRKRELRGAVALAQAEHLEHAGQVAAAEEASLEAHRWLPGSAPAGAMASRLLSARGERAAGLRAIRQTWRISPHPLLADALFELLEGRTAKNTLKTVRAVASTQPEHPESKLLLARAAMAARDWQTVREALNAALAAGESPRACLLMAQLERDGVGDLDAAEHWERRARLMPEGAWECAACGHHEMHWQPHCPQCRAFAQARWVTATPPPPAVHLPIQS